MVARFVRTLIGSSVAPFAGIAATDLGQWVDLGDGRFGMVLGDSFSDRVGGDGWRSPCMLHTTYRDGRIEMVGAVGGERARELIGNQHRGRIPGTDMYEVTVIPSDCVRVGTRLYLSVMSVAEWGPRPGEWRTNLAMLYRSDDQGETWAPTPMVWRNNPGCTDVWQMQSWLVSGGFAYLFGTSNGRLIPDGVFLARVPVERIEDLQAYEYWGFGRSAWWEPARWRWWGHTVRATPILRGMFGEPSVAVVEGQVVLVALRPDMSGSIWSWRAEAPDRPWSGPREQVTQAMLPACYGGFIHPASTLGRLEMSVSQWPLDGPYHIQHWRGAA